MEQCRNSLTRRVFFAFFISVAIIIGFTFIAAPEAKATSPSDTQNITVAPGKGLLFLKANVHQDFYDVLCVTLHDKSADKDFTLKIEGGGAFEVNVTLPIGEYSVVNAYTMRDDSYEVTFDKTELSIQEGNTETITLDVSMKSEINVAVPTDPDPAEEPTEEPTESSEPTPSIEPEPDVEPSETDEPSEEPEPDVTTEEPEPSPDFTEDDEEGGTAKTIVRILISIGATVVFFGVIALVVLIGRRRFSDN